MELDDILTDKKEQTNAEPVIVKDPVENTDVERVKSARHELRERELEARAEGEGKVRDPATGQFVAKEEKKEEPKVEEPKPDPKPEPPKEEFSAKEKALLAAMQEERRKRQEIEQQLLQYKQQPQTPPEPPKPFWEDPDGAVAQYQKALEATKAETAQNFFKQRLEFTEELARVKYPDYNEVVEVFKEVAQQAPGLVQQCMTSQNPAEFAYKLGKHHKEMRDVGSIEEYKKKAEKELRLKIEAELKEKYEKEMKARQELVPSLSDARSTQANKAVWGGPTPLDNILGS
jgi:hypothetical protein